MTAIITTLFVLYVACFYLCVVLVISKKLGHPKRDFVLSTGLSSGPAPSPNNNYMPNAINKHLNLLDNIVESRSTFTAWMDKVLPMMVQMSRRQTETFFTHFVESCSREQRAYLETGFSDLLTQDFMSLPDLARTKILNSLDICSLLNLRLVCKSWEEAVTNLSVVWEWRCQKLPIRMDHSRCVYEAHPCYFSLFMASQRVLHKLSTCSALNFGDIPLSVKNSRDGTCVNHLLVYGNNVLVIGSKERMLMAVDATSGETLWQKTSDTPSCLHISSNLVLAGTYMGAIQVHSLDGLCSSSFQCGAAAVIALDIHESGRFMIVASSDGTLRLVDEEFKIQCVHLQSQMPASDGPVQKVYFLPDSSLGKGQLAVCVCRQRARSVAVLRDSGEVLFQDDCKFDIDVCSFCRSSTEPHALFLSTRCDEPNIEGCIEKHTFHLESSRIFVHVWRAHISSTQPSWSMYHYATGDFGKGMYILAAGKELCIAAMGKSLQVFKILCGTKVYTHSNFFEGEYITRLQRKQETGRILPVHTDWLDGLSPSTAQENVPIIMFSMCLDCRPLIRTLTWTPNLWESLKDGIQCESQNADCDNALDQSDGIQHANSTSENLDCDDALDQSDGIQHANSTSENLDCDDALDQHSTDDFDVWLERERKCNKIKDGQMTASHARVPIRTDALGTVYEHNVAAMEADEERLISHGGGGLRCRADRPLGIWSNAALFKQTFCCASPNFPSDRLL